jgi:hypothetical protein
MVGGRDTRDVLYFIQMPQLATSAPAEIRTPDLLVRRV